MNEDLNRWRKAIERRLDALEGKLDASGSTRSRTDRTLSPREFLLSKPGVKTLADLGLAAGYYLEVVCGADGFDLDDLNRFYSEAKEPRPRAYRDVPYQNVKRGTMRQLGKMVQSRTAHNRWSLTNSGIARVEADLTDGK